jgi:hypothetical protein
MSLPNRLVTAASGIFGTQATTASFRPAGGFAAPFSGEAALFNLLRSLYYGNAAYQDIALDPALSHLALNGRTIRALRNPTQAVTEFYVAVLMPGLLPDALPLDAADGIDATQLQAAAEQLWTWSNWAAKKQTYVRSAAMLGEVYLHVATKPDGVFPPQRVYLDVIQPDYINCYGTERDERGFVTRLRLDMPELDRDNPIAAVWWHTEVWDKDTQTARYWTRSTPPSNDINALGTPDREVTFRDMGIDYVPFVHVPFLDMGEERGVSPVLPALDKIMELDQLATSLHQALYRYNSPDKIIEGSARGNDGEIPAPPRLSDTQELQIAGITAYSLPPGWTMHNDVAGVHYAEQLQTIEAHWEALRETNLPELYYWATPDSGAQESGRALETRLKGAISRATEARGNLEAGLVRAMQMAFSLGKAWKLAPFTALGDYAAGGMDFGFQRRDILPESDDDKMDRLSAKVTALKTLVDAGASIAGAAAIVGFSAEDAAILAAVDLTAVAP